MTPRVLTEKQAAPYVGLSESTLRQSRCKSGGEIDAPPWVKFGKAVRYVVDDLDAWIERHRTAEASA